MVNSGELIEAWRADVLDDVEPYLWPQTEAVRYAEAAYRRFVRLTGGIHDFTSPLTRVDIVAGEELAAVSPLILRFDMQGFGVSGGSACSSHSLEPSHVLRSLGIDADRAHGALRISMGRYTDEADVEAFAVAMEWLPSPTASTMAMVKTAAALPQPRAEDLLFQIRFMPYFFASGSLFWL